MQTERRSKRPALALAGQASDHHSTALDCIHLPAPGSECRPSAGPEMAGSGYGRRTQHSSHGLPPCMQVMLADGAVVALEPALRSRLQASIDQMAGGALRCLAFAVKDDLGELSGYNGESHPGHRLLLDSRNYPDIESGMTWLGVAGLRDPPRAEVAGAIQECYQAGIRVSHGSLHVRADTRGCCWLYVNTCLYHMHYNDCV